MFSLGCSILTAVGTGLLESPCHRLPVMVHVPNAGSVGVNRTMAPYRVPASPSHRDVHLCGAVPGGEAPPQSWGCGAQSGGVEPAWSQGSLRLVAPWECSFSGARETIPKKEQSDGKLIPNGDTSPLRNKV